MNSKILIFIFLMMIFSSGLVAQQPLAGHVYEWNANHVKVPLEGAMVVISGTTIYTTTDDSGSFYLEKPVGSADQIIISAPGYRDDTVNAMGAISAVLVKVIELGEVEVSGNGSDSYISSMNTAKTEVLTSGELKLNACCNLSESFESNPTVDVSFSDAVTGARQIQMLGLAGKYAQIMTDVLPTVRGLGITYGFNYIPGPWIESINLNKGAGSVANGYESITGQIDVELKKPEKSEPLFVNVYGNSDARIELNVNAAQKLNDKWYNMFLLHGDALQSKIDGNGDHFLDLPRNKTISLMDRWKVQPLDHVEAMFGGKWLYDDRIGGALDFDPDYDKLTTHHYGIGLTTNRAELFAKSSYGFEGKEYQSMGIQLSGIYHHSDGYFGIRPYTGDERSFYANLLFLSAIGNTQHKFKTGLSYLYDKYEEQFGELQMNRTESVPGAFFEYTYDNLKKLSLVAGVRGDYHNLYGFVFTPRLHVKYALGNTSTLRASAGSGFRVANIFAENTAYLASSREWIVEEELQPEKAWSYGINYTQKFYAGVREGSASIDLYRTDFTSQVIVDADADPTKVFFYNLDGRSYSNTFQVEVNYEWFRGFTTRAAYKYYDVKQTYDGEIRQVPLVPKERALFTAIYKTNNDHWQFSSTLQWNGMQRLQNTASNPEIYQVAEESPSYFKWMGQVTFSTGKWEFYAGGENLTNFTQDDPVIAAGDPFGPYFDTSIVWGPITGRTVYGGIRFTVK